jgi:disulfide bond formation protein DsbB
VAPARVWTGAALLVAVLTVAGSLWLSLGMGLKACPLCLYQRTFAMAAVAVLGLGCLGKLAQPAALCQLALPLAIGGAGVAAFHEYLEWSGTLECPAGVWALGTAPQQSLLMLSVLSLLLVLGSWRTTSRALLAGGLLLGILMAIATIASAPPLPKAPSKAYETPLDMCRPPFVSEPARG